MKKFGLIVLSVVLLTSCSMYKDVEIVEVKDFELVEYSEDLVQIDLELEVMNPNGYKVKLLSSDIDLSLNGEDLGKLRLKEQMVLPKKSTSVQTMKVLADYDAINDGIMENIMSLMFAQAIIIEAKGEVKGKALGIAKRVDVDVKEEVTLDDLGIGF